MEKIYVDAFVKAEKNGTLIDFLDKNHFALIEQIDNAIIYENKECYLFHNKFIGTPSQYNKSDFSLEEAKKNEETAYDFK